SSRRADIQRVSSRTADIQKSVIPNGREAAGGILLIATASRFRARVRAPLRAAALRRAAPLVRTALRADADLADAPRRRATMRACLPSARGDAAVCGWLLSALRVARERRADGRPVLRRLLPVLLWALERDREDPPFRGSLTPARRALESPMAIACSVEAAPCFPSRT